MPSGGAVAAAPAAGAGAAAPAAEVEGLYCLDIHSAVHEFPRKFCQVLT